MLHGSILQKLRDAHRPGNLGKRSLNFGVYFKNTLVALCHALEDSILEHDYSPLVITAFQRGKWYLQEADRYRDIAGQSHQIVIMAAPEAGFAEHPTSQLENVALVSLSDTDPVAQEWHLIILSPNYTAMVLCQELSDEDYVTAGVPQTDLERKFYGLWTFEPNLVMETAELAIAHLQQYDPALASALTAQLQEIKRLAQAEDALCGSPTAEHLGDIVLRVVDYLQDTQQDLLQTEVYSRLGREGLDHNLISNELQAFLRVAQLIDQTDLSNPMAAAEVATLAETLGQLLDLPAWQLHRLRLAGLLHRVAQLQSVGTELTPSSARYQDAAAAPSCPLVPGTQLLRKMNRMRAIATILNHQNEYWDGSGYPAGLAGDEIPLESRILGLLACFQQRLAERRGSVQPILNPQAPAPSDQPEALAEVFAQCQSEQSDRWDPKLVEALGLLVNGLQQGLSLSVAVPKIAAGMWLLDSRSEADWQELGAIANSPSAGTPST